MPGRARRSGGLCIQRVRGPRLCSTACPGCLLGRPAPSLPRGLRRNEDELKSADEALTRSRQPFVDVSEAAPKGLILHRDGVAVYANPVAMAMFGLPPGEDRQKLSARVAPSERPGFETWLAA